MINRIVRMSFDPEKVPAFLEVFEQSREKISNFPGCQGLTLLRDANLPNVFFTYSYWDDPENLDAYRFSELFRKVWGATKVHFNEKPLAWSLIVVDRVK